MSSSLACAFTGKHCALGICNLSYQPPGRLGEHGRRGREESERDKRREATNTHESILHVCRDAAAEGYRGGEAAGRQESVRTRRTRPCITVD